MLTSYSSDAQGKQCGGLRLEDPTRRRLGSCSGSLPVKAPSGDPGDSAEGLPMAVQGGDCLTEAEAAAMAVQGGDCRTEVEAATIRAKIGRIPPSAGGSRCNKDLGRRWASHGSTAKA